MKYDSYMKHVWKRKEKRKNMWFKLLLLMSWKMYACDTCEMMIYRGSIDDGCEVENPRDKAIMVTLEPYDIH